MSTATVARRGANSKTSSKAAASKASKAKEAPSRQVGRINDIHAPYWQGIVQYAGLKRDTGSWVCDHCHRDPGRAMQCAMQEVRSITKVGAPPLVELSAFSRYQEP